MRCICCNNNLNDYESTLRGALTGDFLDTCRKCLKDLDIKVLPNINDPDEAAVDEHYWDFPEIQNDLSDYGDDYV